MRVALVHNIVAGDRSHATEDLARLFNASGHDVEVFGSKKGQMRRAIAANPDVLVVAGGDGTVARSVKAIHKLGTQVPLFVLPAGTSNNIARSLGIHESPQTLVHRLASARPARLDVGVVDGALGRKRFIEGAGVGFIGVMLERDGTMSERLTRIGRSLLRPRLKPRERSRRGVALLIKAQPASYHRIVADGEDLSGEYIAVEAMNIREIGPRVGLAPNADAGDGLLDLVLIRPEDRERLAHRVEVADAAAADPIGVVRRVQCVTISWPRSGGHVDDGPWPGGEAVVDRQMSLSIQGAIRVLRPP